MQQRKATLFDKARVCGRAAQVGMGVLIDRATSRNAVAADDVPGSAAQITPEWLTAVLCRHVPGGRVLSFEVTGGSSGTSTRTGLALALNDAAKQAGVPEHLFTKSTTSFAQRMFLGIAGALTGETGFYLRIRPQVDIEAPRGYFACMDHVWWRSMVIMEDIVATKGAQFISTETYIDRATAEGLLANMAKWHGHFWENPQLNGSLSWLRKPSFYLAEISKYIAMKKRSQIAIDKYSHLVPADIRNRTDELWDALATSFDINLRMPQTFLHGDCHIGQTYLTQNHRIGYSDWQVVLQGGWAYDFNYGLVSALTVEDRRSWERDLLRYYLDCLHASGGPRLDFDEAWLRYRQHSIYPYFCWAYTRAGAGAMQPDFQPDYVCNDILTRTAHAVSDLDALNAVKEG